MANDRTFQQLTAALLAALLSACAAVPKAPPPLPRPVPVPAPVPAPRPAPPPADWRDAPQTPGDWRWTIANGMSQARFAGPKQPYAMIACDRGAQRIVLARFGTVASATPFVVRTTFGERHLMSNPAVQPDWIALTLQPRDPLLDQIAFSRGRFTIEVAGQPTLYLPSWPEISRVIEDCR